MPPYRPASRPFPRHRPAPKPRRPRPTFAEMDAVHAASDAFAARAFGASNALPIPAPGFSPALACEFLSVLGSVFADAFEGLAERARRRYLTSLNHYAETRRIAHEAASLITRDDLALCLGLHVRRIEQLEAQGVLHAVGHYDGQTVYPLASVRALFERGLLPVTSN